MKNQIQVKYNKDGLALCKESKYSQLNCGLIDEQSVHFIHSYVTYGLKYNIVRKLYKQITRITHINILYECVCVHKGKVLLYVSDNSGFLMNSACNRTRT